eukprot:UN11521
MENIENKCDVKFDLFCDFPLTITENESKFIQKSTGFNGLNIGHELNDNAVQYGECIVRKGLIIVSYGENDYFFKLIGDDNGKNLELQLFGCGLARFNVNDPIVIYTSRIPLHWKIMRIGKVFCSFQAILGNNVGNGEDIIVVMDAFTQNMEEFAITQTGVSMDADISYEEIPNNMEFIRLPFDDYDFIMEQFPFFID